MPAGEFHHPSPPPQPQPQPPPPPGSDAEKEWVWSQIKFEARVDAKAEQALASYLCSKTLSHFSLERSLSFYLSNKLCSSTLLSPLLYDLFLNIFSNDSSLVSAAVAVAAARFRDPACTSFSHSRLNYKEFLACQAQRVAHKLWTQSRRPLALALQSRISDVFAIDIHPPAKIGKGILFDRATGVVVGETAVIGNNVSILHHLALGGTGKFGGDRHPKIGDGVLIGAMILGNVKIGEGAKIGAGSLVLIDQCVQETRVVSNAGIGCREKPEGHADRSKEKRDNPECGGGGGGVGGAMAAEHGEYASGGSNGSGRRRQYCGGFKSVLITLLLILSPSNAFFASRQPHAPPSPYSPQSPIFPPKTHYPPPPLAGNNNPSDNLLAPAGPPPLDEDTLSDILGTPPPPSEDDCRSLC